MEEIERDLREEEKEFILLDLCKGIFGCVSKFRIGKQLNFL